jgi:hypothetical protein
LSIFKEISCPITPSKKERRKKKEDSFFSGREKEEVADCGPEDGTNPILHYFSFFPRQRRKEEKRRKIPLSQEGKRRKWPIAALKIERILYFIIFPSSHVKEGKKKKEGRF